MRIRATVAGVLISLCQIAAQGAPYEGFPAADFTRGERAEPGSGSIGVYSHYRRFDRVYQNDDHLAAAGDPRHSRFTPTMIFERRFSRTLSTAVKWHNAVIRTNVAQPGGGRTIDDLTALGDVYLYGIWNPWLGDVPEGHEHTFLDLHNLTFAGGFKFDVGAEDPQFGAAPGADFRRTATGNPGTNEIVAAVGYVGHWNESAWLYSYSQYLIPVDETVFGMKPGNRLESQYGISWIANERTQVFGQIGYIHQERGKGGSIPAAVTNSGLVEVSVTPGLTLDIYKGWGIEAAVTVPLYHKVRGTQLTGREDLFLGIYKPF